MLETHGSCCCRLTSCSQHVVSWRDRSPATVMRCTERACFSPSFFLTAWPLARRSAVALLLRPSIRLSLFETGGLAS